MLRRYDDASASFDSDIDVLLPSQATDGRDPGGKRASGRVAGHPAAERRDGPAGERVILFRNRTS